MLIVTGEHFFTHKLMLTNQNLIDLGFVPVPTYTIGNNVTYDLGRNRHLAVSCAGTPNEMVLIYETDPVNPKKVEDLIPLHNYDYDGYLTEERVKLFMQLKSIPKTEKAS